MAFYDFACEDCKKYYPDIMQSMNEEHIYVCPSCGKTLKQDYTHKGLAFDSSCACMFGCNAGGWATGASFERRELDNKLNEIYSVNNDHSEDYGIDYKYGGDQAEDEMNAILDSQK